MGHDPRIRGCDQLLSATAKDMADQVANMFKAADEIKEQVKRDLRVIEDYVQEVAVDSMDLRVTQVEQ